MIQIKYDFLQKIHTLLATGFYSGYSKYCPGTVGTLASIPIIFSLNILFSPRALLLPFLLFTLYSFFICWDVSKIFKSDDPREIVIDEWLGFFVTVYCLPINFTVYLLGFILFRIFDIIKPFPINYIDRNIKYGVGVVLDDIVAGIFANVSIRLLIFAYTIF